MPLYREQNSSVSSASTEHTIGNSVVSDPALSPEKVMLFNGKRKISQECTPLKLKKLSASLEKMNMGQLYSMKGEKQRNLTNFSGLSTETS